jgi:apolipoprotein N-acyltransferase
VLDAQPWDTMAGIKRKIPPAGYLTFYVRFGDIISKAAAGMAMLIVLASIIFRVRYSFTQNKLK